MQHALRLTLHTPWVGVCQNESAAASVPLLCFERQAAKKKTTGYRRNMSSAGVLPLEHWPIVFHETMAAILRAQEAVRREVGLWGCLNGLWRSNKDLGMLNASLKQISELGDSVVGEEFYRSMIPQLKRLLASIEELVDTAKRHKLLNRSLTGTVLGSIRIRGEFIADFLEGIEMSFDPEVLDAVQAGQEQIERGEFETMERLF